MRIRWEFSNASLVVKLHTFKLFKHILLRFSYIMTFYKEKFVIRILRGHRLSRNVTCDPPASRTHYNPTIHSRRSGVGILSTIAACNRLKTYP